MANLLRRTPRAIFVFAYRRISVLVDPLKGLPSISFASLSEGAHGGLTKLGRYEARKNNRGTIEWCHPKAFASLYV